VVYRHGKGLFCGICGVDGGRQSEGMALWVVSTQGNQWL